VSPPSGKTVDIPAVQRGFTLLEVLVAVTVLALALTAIISGVDSADPTAADLPVAGWDDGIEDGVRGLKIGVPTRYFLDGMTTETSRLFAAATEVYRALGAEIVEVAPPNCEEMSALATIIIAVEAASVHGAWFRERPQDYSDQVRARIALGFHHPATRYVEALMLRGRHLDGFGAAVFDRVDAMLAPVLPIATPTIAETDIGGSRGMGTTVAAMTRCCRPINYLGLPSLSIPAGFTKGGLPWGVQLVGRPFAEPLLFRLGRAYERGTEWLKHRPLGF